MGMTTALVGLAAVAGLGAIAAQGPAAATVSNASAKTTSVAAGQAISSPATQPGAAPVSAPPAAIATTTASSTASTPAAPATATTPSIGPVATPGAAPTAPAPPRCDDGDWRGPDGINVDGQPDGFDAGNRGAVYLWHSSDGWHIRTTDVTDTAHHYTGTIALSPGARFTSFSTVRLENADRVWVDGDNVLHYDFTTYNGIDGVNFTVSACDGAREHEAMHFDMDYNGHEDDPARINIGDRKQHPDSANFIVTRTI